MNKALQCAIQLLARREHSLAELTDKLSQKGYLEAEIEEALTLCQSKGLQSNLRFTESLCRTRIRQGYGPVRIRQELVAKGVERNHIDDILCGEHHQWITHAQEVWTKKYKMTPNASFVEKQKQRQFLFYRGFTTEMIAQVVK